MKAKFVNLCQSLGLGVIIQEPKALTGGLMHKMYQVTTDQGSYCIKVLNPEVMARPEALGNLIRSEEIASALQDLVPLSAAKRFDGSAVIKQEQQFYMVFDFLEGSPIYAPGLSPKQCAAIGNLLGIIHKADVRVPGIQAETADAPIFQWESFQKMALQQEWGASFIQVIPKLKEWNQKAAEAAQILSARQVISHRDLDPKNVMWQGDSPVIIDWEAAGYVNPYQELMEVCSYWAADTNGGVDPEKFDALLQAYRQSVSLDGVDWEPVLAGGMNGMLGWLEYNLKRALHLIECPAEEQKLGIQQVEGTIRELYEYEAKSGTMKRILNS